MAEKKSFLQEQSEARTALAQLPDGGVFDGASLFSAAEVDGLRATIREAWGQNLRVYVATTQHPGIAHTLAKALFDQLQRDAQDVVIVVGQERVAAWSARLDQAQLGEQIRQTSYARAQGAFAGTRALIERLAAAQATQAMRRTLLWGVSGAAALGGAAAAVLVWIGKRRQRVAAYTRELHRIYDRVGQVGQLLEDVELEARFQPEQARAHRLIQDARARYLGATALLEQVRISPPADPSTALPALASALEDARDGLEKARRMLQGASSPPQAQSPPAAPPKSLGDRAFSRRWRQDGSQG